MGTDFCTGASALQLAATGLSFLAAVILLDVFWVRLPEEVRSGDPAPTMKRQSLLNLFVALGATGAAAMLLVWVTACGA